MLVLNVVDFSLYCLVFAVAKRSSRKFDENESGGNHPGECELVGRSLSGCWAQLPTAVGDYFNLHFATRNLMSPIEVFWLFGILIVLLGVLSQAADDHTARLQQVVNKKTIEAQHANAHANALLSTLKSKNADLTSSIKREDLFASQTKLLHEHHLATAQKPRSSERTVAREDWVDSLGPEHKMHSTLAAHGVKDTLVREINNMAASNIQRDAIVKHVQTHFPDKDPHEWNDIVVSAIGVSGKFQPDVSQTTKSSRNEALLQQQRFKRDKRSLENKQEAQ